MSAGAKILEGLKDAVAGNFASVYINGQTWARVDWQPIETAPKDGSWLLVPDTRYGRTTSCMARWNDQRYHRKPKPYWEFVDESVHGVAASRANQPSIWQPIPKPPGGAV